MVLDYGAGEASGLVLSTTQIPMNFKALSPETLASCTVPPQIRQESPGKFPDFSPLPEQTSSATAAGKARDRRCGRFSA
jgi:hypothetical protein